MADLDLSDGGKHVRTRDGKCVRIYTTNHVGGYPIVGWIEGRAGISTWTKDGCYYHKHTNDTYDLVPCSPTVTWLVDVPEGVEPICFCPTGEVRQVNGGEYYLVGNGVRYLHCGHAEVYPFPILAPVQPRKAK